ncbi:MAG: hypothetical protein E5W55_02255 [Mesorhizobium sp.]|nr:MAG: hypothetical protein E5W55_02255 [Mesorhizobium sp.]
MTGKDDFEELEFEECEEIEPRRQSEQEVLARFRQDQIDMIRLFKSVVFRAKEGDAAESDSVLSVLLDFYENGSEDERAAAVQEMIEIAKTMNSGT